MGKIISIGNQKGGVGKSTITSFVANYLHRELKEKDFKVLVIDADDLQNSLYKIRQEELKTFENEDFYDLIRMDSKDLKNNLEALKNEYNLVFVDLPGNLKQEGIVSAYVYIDVLFIPTQTSKIDIDSTVDFVNFYHKTIYLKRKEQGLQTSYTLFFNRVNEKNKDFKEMYNSRNSLGIPIMDNYICESIPTFQRKVSTVYKYNSATRGEYSDFINEMINVITQ